MRWNISTLDLRAQFKLIISKHFPIDQYLHDRVTPATLSPQLLTYDKLIDPSEMLEYQHVQTQLQTIPMYQPKMTNTHG